MIRYLRESEKKNCRDLWEEAFREDSASFTDYYFAHALPRNRILADIEDDRVHSMIHLNPYRLRVRDRVWNAAYLVGVATREADRRQGRMRSLLLRALADLRGEKMPFCFLMPADEAIYKPFGFTYIADRQDLTLTEHDCPERRSAQELLDGTEKAKLSAELAAWMNAYLERHYQVFALRDEAYLERLLLEIASEDGTFDLLYDGGRMVGMESIWGLSEREQRFLYGEPPYVCAPSQGSFPPACAPSAGKPAIMGRIVDLPEFMRAIRLKETAPEREVTVPLSVEDKLLPENGGDWLWHLDHETSWLERGDGDERLRHAEGETSRAEPLRLGIERLTAWLFGYRTPEAALQYQEMIDVLQGVLLDEVV